MHGCQSDSSRSHAWSDGWRCNWAITANVLFIIMIIWYEQPCSLPFSTNESIKKYMGYCHPVNVAQKACCPSPNDIWRHSLRNDHTCTKIHSASVLNNRYLVVAVLVFIQQEMLISELQAETTYSVAVAAYTTKGDGARSKPKLVSTTGAGEPRCQH